MADIAYGTNTFQCRLRSMKSRVNPPSSSELETNRSYGLAVCANTKGGGEKSELKCRYIGFSGPQVLDVESLSK